MSDTVYVGQKGAADCAIACIAMLTQLQMEDIKLTIPYDPEDNMPVEDVNEYIAQYGPIPLMGVSEVEISTILNNLGLVYQTEVTVEHVLANLEEGDPFKARWESCGLYKEADLKRNLVLAGNPALVMVDLLNNNYYHMVYFDGKVVWDPQAPSKEQACSNLRSHLVRSAWIFNPKHLT